MNNSTTNLVQPELITQPIELVEPPQCLIESPDTWMRDGNSPAEIILAVAVLVGAIAGLLRVLVPVMTPRSSDKSN